MATNLVLTGFMGTGKTTVGQALARELQRPFVDMDARIEAQAGKPIPRIFAEDGEGAFRQIEAALCVELSQQEGLIIATGGGALVNPANREAFQRTGTILCLDATPDEILQRVRGADGDAVADRPLLAVADPRAEIVRLLALRREAYRAIPWHIGTTGRAVAGIVAQAREMAEVITLPVRHPGGAYPIHIGRGLLAHLGGALASAGVSGGTAVAIVTNPIVGTLYVAQVETGLRAAGYAPFVCVIPDGESHKTLDTVRALYGLFLKNNFDRSSVVLALGGGVTGDIAGFAAATFMRGTRFVQVPTTLLAMSDASVGGKTGVDLPQGKNLVGAFKEPELVLIDLDTLRTLPEVEFQSGMAEVIKHGVIADAGLFEELAALGHQPKGAQRQLPASLLARSLRVKIDVVEEDPYEKGRRAVLNLGHTTAHGLEQTSDFTLRHGHAVSIGMVIAARIAETTGVAESRLASRVSEVLRVWGLPVTCPPVNVDAIWNAMIHDKKKQGKVLRWVLPRAIGETTIAHDVPTGVVKKVLLEMGATE
ncbi:MAG: 3-dehydroquinate synthase [Anaerolineae bacterium]|nr:3-dehydroquinate synthase [Anaerolineae bacterium]